jgi:putative restriction endonuclease
LFRALEPGELFLFKLHRPRDFIVGGGLFTHSTLLPLTLAWDTFGRANGAQSLTQMRERVERYRRSEPDPHGAYRIGCILLASPFFLREDLWIPCPPDWKPNIVQGRSYDLTIDPGRTLWSRLHAALRFDPGASIAPAIGELPRFGSPTLVTPRLGQGTFRVLVTDAYDRRCAVTRERTLPALEAGHIRPYSEGGEHRVDNGLLLRRDLHELFDRGYVTVTPDYRLEVSRRIREEFENGRDYYALQGHDLLLPRHRLQRPAISFLSWHNEHRFLG